MTLPDIEVRADPEKLITQFLEFSGHYDPNAAALLKAGRFWTPAKKPRDIAYGEMKMCFQNSYRGMMHDGLRYVEGIAFSGMIPVHHAWNVDEDDNVVDKTWRTTGPKRHWHPLDKVAYFGVEISEEDLRKVLMRTKTYGALFKQGGYDLAKTPDSE
jgi:hypothetical protein